MSLLKISLTISIIGIFTLLLISEYSAIESQSIKELTKDQLETKVKIQGKLLSIKETPGLYILKVSDFTSTIPVIIFKEEPLNLKKNSQIIVEGTLTEYQNELEILAETIRSENVA